MEVLNKNYLLINTQLYIHAVLYPSTCGWIIKLLLTPEQIAVGKICNFEFLIEDQSCLGAHQRGKEFSDV